jgi:hypothetical protein
LADPVFKGYVHAGFECGQLNWANGHTQNLSVQTRHSGYAARLANYRRVHALGVRTIRDGLPPNCSDVEVLRAMHAARAAGLEVLWDLLHFGLPAAAPDVGPQLDAWVAHRAALIAQATPQPWLTPVCEPGTHAHFAAAGGMWAPASRSPHELKAGLLQAYRAARSAALAANPASRFMLCDPVMAAEPHEYDALDQLASSGDLPDVVGVNFYAHDLRQPIAHVLATTAERYGRPVYISETGLHCGHPHNHRQGYGGWRRGEWLRHVVEQAAASPVQPVGVCWYPIVEMPAWRDHPTDEVWPCGLIRPDGSHDPELELAFKELCNA